MGKIKILRLPTQTGDDEIGQKARNLQWLAKHRWRVPKTFVLPASIGSAYQSNPILLRQQLQILLEKSIKAEQAYAVRSSANVEDSERYSYAGQFRSLLNVRGMLQILEAVENVLESAQSMAVRSYSQKISQHIDNLLIAVIIQEMVTPVISGVSFSKDPLTGLDETVVEAVEGLGEALVQEGRTPLRWVNKWGSWTSQPVSMTIDEKIIGKVVEQTRQIAWQFNAPVDLEWVYDGQEVYWVQLRPITRLDEVNIYSNRISRELFSGIIKPLVWSVNIPLVNGGWIELFTELVGPNDLKAEDLAKSFGYRAYFNMGAVGRILTLMGLPSETLELMLGLEGGQKRPRFRPSGKTYRLLPRMLSFAVRNIRLGPGILQALAEIRQEYDKLQETRLDSLDDYGILNQINQLYEINRKPVQLSIVVPLLMSLYYALLRGRLSGSGIDIARLNITQGLAEMEEYDPNPHLHQLAEHFNKLDQATREIIANRQSYDSFMNLKGIQELQSEVAEFLRHFGHMCDRGNDFSSAPWRETPNLVLQMMVNEAQRSAELAEKSAKLEQPGASHINWEYLAISPFKRWLLMPLYKRARNFQLYREAVSATYSYGYGLFRVYFVELGKRFQAQNLIKQVEDIFFLTWDEIKMVLQGELLEVMELVAQRKADMLATQDMLLPEIIYGEEMPPAIDPAQANSMLKGIPSSPGYYRGPIKVIQSISQMNKLDSGDVLVIPYSDVGWTPLFSRAGAVIAESGGILSHSSIVAREYRIPAVVSVPFAMRLPDHILVTVDGYRGEIILHGDQPTQA